MTSGAAPDAVKAARPVLNGEDEETGQKGTAPCPYPTSPHGEGLGVCVRTAGHVVDLHFTVSHQQPKLIVIDKQLVAQLSATA